ncbi:hypothetical protein AAFF_G00394140 [Aldrovandia affinis]|uniref:Uncharacterized protein n=1 Tax=Aldrovandia affinis TaxID=143900 RepID=A0AAD7SDM9_9TELE|nr:hypothetical protein AAFF_G00394140 [Aldrovandia affinis]
MRGAECWTDNRMIVTKLHMKVRPAQQLQKSSKRRLHCPWLRKAEARNEFRCLTAEKLKVIEPLLSSEDPMDEKWVSLSSVLYEAAAQSISYRGRNDQDWFDENSDTITTYWIICTKHTGQPSTTQHLEIYGSNGEQHARKEVQTSLWVLQNE